MVSSKFILLSVTALIMGAAMLAFLTGAGDSFYFEAISADPEQGEATDIYH